MKKYCKLIGYGGFIWGVAFVVASIFIALKVTSGWLMQGTTTLIVLLTTYFLAKSLNISKISEMLKYGFSWMVTGMVLDLLVTTKFNPNFFSNCYIYLAYLLMVFVTLLAVKKPA